MKVEEIQNLTEHDGDADPHLLRPAVRDASERSRQLKEIVNEMRNNPIPAEAPHLTREDFHARS